MSRCRSLVALILWLVLVSSASSSLAAERGLWYVVRSKTATAYLVGSVHVGRADFYPLPATLEKSFAAAGPLVMEIDPDKMNAPDVQQRTLGLALYPEGDSLRNHVKPETYRRAVAGAGRLGLPEQVLSRFKPWMLAVTLQVFCFQQAGLSPDYGIDRYLARRGKELGKPLVELESVDAQMALMNGFSSAESEDFLLGTLDDLDDGAAIDAMIGSWETGDAAGLEAAIMKPLQEHPETAPIYEKLFFNRNRAMAAGIERLMAERQRPFVVVGAGHLVGKRGIVAILRSKGYQVEQQ